MNYVVFDLEWNQPMDEASTIQNPVYLAGEIIEIGAVKLNENFQPIDELRLYIIPQYYKKMHKQIVALTGIHDKDLAEKGVPFIQAYKEFINWCGEEYAFMTWSMNDMPMLIDNMVLHGIDVTDLPACYDIQRIFSREIMRGETRYSLDTALTLLREKGDSSHDALHDARNTAKVCTHLDLNEYLHEYTSRVFAERPTGVRYETRKQILKDNTLREFFCPWCGTKVNCDQWISISGSTHIAYGLCPDGDEFLVQLSVVNHQRKEYSVKRIIFEMSDDLWDIYMDKKDALGA